MRVSYIAATQRRYDELAQIEGFGTRRDKRYSWFTDAVKHVNAGKDASTFAPDTGDSLSQMQTAGRDGFGPRGGYDPQDLAVFSHGNGAGSAGGAGSAKAAKKPPQAATSAYAQPASAASPYFSSAPQAKRALPTVPFSRPAPTAPSSTAAKQSARPPVALSAPRTVIDKGMREVATALHDPVKMGGKRKAPKNNSVF